MDMKSLRERCQGEEAALRVRYLAQGHFGSALKTPQHLSCYQPTSHFLGPSNRSCTRHLWLPAPPPSESEQSNVSFICDTKRFLASAWLKNEHLRHSFCATLKGGRRPQTSSYQHATLSSKRNVYPARMQLQIYIQNSRPSPTNTCKNVSGAIE